QTSYAPDSESQLLRHPPVATGTKQSASFCKGNGKKSPPHDAGQILCEFFFDDQQASRRDATDRRSSYRLDFIIVTIPDPLDSRLPYLFDRNLGSIQRAAESQGWVLDRFDLPWIDELRRKGNGKDNDAAVNETDPRKTEDTHDFRTSPGFLLYRDPAVGKRDKPRALLLFLVGETPTSGIHKAAMLSALRQIDSFCDSPDGTSEVLFSEGVPHPDKSVCSEIKVLGPSFSGSAES